MKWYVYKLIDPITKAPIYVGKGKEKRMYRHWNDAVNKNIIPHGNINLYKILRNIDNNGKNIIYEKVYVGLDEEEAFNQEVSLINELGRRDLNTGNLCNMTNGGEGPSKRVVSEETRRKISEKLKGRVISDEHVKKIKKSLLKPGSFHTSPKPQWYLDKLSKAQTGKVKSEEHKEKIRQAVLKQHGNARAKYPPKEKLKQCLDDKMNWTQIGKKYGFSKTTARNLAKRMELI